MSKKTGARYFAQLLEAYGVTHIFFMDAIDNLPVSQIFTLFCFIISVSTSFSNHN